jgi:Cu(I)/Ag(I) efflux system membrane fusion protein
MRHSFVSLAAAALLTACGSGPEPARVESGGLEIRAEVEPETPRVGENRLSIELRDPQGRPVEGAGLEVKVHMHAMGAMPAMGGPAAVAELGGGRYRADFALDMGGTWQVEIRAGGSAGAEGSLSVGTPGLRLAPRPGSAAAAPAPSAPLHDRGAAPPAAAPAAPGAHPGEFQVAPERLQRIGVRSARAELRAVSQPIRASGRVVVDETRLADVSLKVAGWVGELRADALGVPVHAGEVLFTLYSPELHAAQEEYLLALSAQARARESSAPERADALVRAARNRLARWDVAGADLDALAQRGAASERLPIRSPASGFVVEKNVVAGAAVAPGARLYRIAPLDPVWVEAEVYEAELARVAPGMPAEVTLAYLPGRRFEGRVAFVQPGLSPDTRTARVRVELANPDLALRPDMWATVRLESAAGERLLVPLGAVLHAGERSFVFLDLGEGRFRPQAVEVGMRAGEEVEILAGLEPGQAVVASGTFLVASESRLRAALEQW